MRTSFIVTLLLLRCSLACFGQNTIHFADSILKVYRIPELSYAVVSADSVYEIQTLGIRKAGTQLKATLNDKFRIGSNTKAITALIAARLVKQEGISWNTRFFDLFPEMKAGSRKAYHELTLLNLLSFRTKLFPYTYTDAKPVKGQFKGNEEEQRYQFTQWFLTHAPVKNHDSICFSNLGYVAAGLMLEKASGKSYEQLVNEFGTTLDIHFGFGQPNRADALQTWGHNDKLVPEPPTDNYKLSWLLAAGNINVTIKDYLKFVQLQLRGLQGRSDILTKEEFNFLHFGLQEFAVGWFNDTHHQPFSYNIGNPGSFLTKVFIFKNANKAFVVFCNAQTDAADDGTDVLLEELKRKYLPKAVSRQK